MRRTIRLLLIASITFVTSSRVAHAGGPITNVLMNTASAATDREHTPVLAGVGSNLVAVWGHTSPTRLYYGTSVDGGNTFMEAGEVPAFSGYAWRLHPQIVANPKTGEFWLAGMMLATSPTRVRLTVVKGTFSGPSFSWGTPTFVGPDIVVPFVFVNPLVNLAADTTSGNLYLSFDDIYSSPAGVGVDALLVYRSFDGGASWSGPLTGLPYLFPTQLEVSATGGLVVTGGSAATDPLHADYVSVTSANPADPVPSWNSAALSSDVPINRLTLPGINAADEPSLAVDRTQGAHHGRLYHGRAESPPYDLVTLPDPLDPLVQDAEVELNGDPGSATPVQVGHVIHGGFSDIADEDYYSLTLTAGDMVIVSPDSASADAYLTLDVLAPDGTQKLGSLNNFLGTNYYPGLFTAPATGLYYLAVRRLAGITPYDYRVRLAYGVAGTVARDTRDVLIAHSDDNGTTWSSAVRANDDSPVFDNTVPVVAVGGDGCPYAWWLDFRDDPYGSRSHVYISRSVDGGDTWEAATVVTTAQTNWTTVVNQYPAAGYGTMIAVGPRMHLVWTDGRSGNQDVYSASFPTDFELSDCTSSPMGAPGDDVAIGVTVSNHNPLFANDYSVTLTDERGWPLSGTQSTAPPDGQAMPGLVVPVPDTAAAGVNTVTVHVANAMGTLELTCDVALEVTASTGVGNRAARFALEAIRPNPARGRADFGCELAAAGRATLVLYGLRGEIVRTLIDAELPAGPSTVRWDGRDARGQRVAPGVYYIKFAAEGRTAVRRFAYLR